MIEFTNCKCNIEKGKFSINDIPLKCPAVWRLISSGHTVGIFQLETNLGQDWSKRVRPDSIEELAALTALLRPGPLNSNMTQDYVDIKFGRKKKSYLHPSLKSILEPTYGCLVYQEQAIRIATDLAGLSPESADELRKAIGKKKPELMAKVKSKFVKGAQEYGKIGRGIAEEIFGWIEKCQRYSFNKCVAGSTIIKRPTKGKNLSSSSYTVDHMYHIKHDPQYAKLHGHESLRCKWLRSGNYGKGLSLCFDERIRPNTIIDIRSVGVCNVYKITLENGKTIIATCNHKFPTQDGEKMLGCMRVGDYLYVCGQYEQSDLNSINKFNNKFVQSTGKRWRGQKGYPSELVRVESIMAIGSEPVWDVTMDGPNHNFITGDDIVTCNSHAVSYGMIAYQTAWLKCHFPHEFFTSYLTYSQYKGDPKKEIYKLVQDARLFGVDILPPDIRRGNIHFQMTEEPQKGVAFGLAHIRSVGASAIKKIVTAISETPGEGSLETWGNFLAAVPNFHRNVGLALIKSGACDCYVMKRSEMVRELEVILGASDHDSIGKRVEIKGLTNKEKIYFFNQLQQGILTTQDILLQMAQPPGNKTKTMGQMTKKELITAATEYLDQANTAFDGIIDGDSKFVCTSFHEKTTWFNSLGDHTKKEIVELMLQNGYKDVVIKSPCSSDARRRIIAAKAKMFEDPLENTNTVNATAEKHFLGIALSCSQADDADDTLATHTCLEIAKAPNREAIVVCAIIDSVKHTKTKRGSNPGQPMCFITISDSTYSIDHAVVFPDVFGRLKAFCKDDLICLIYGEKKNGSFIIKDIQKLM